MEFVRVNKAIWNHIEYGKDLSSFEHVESGRVRSTGHMACTGQPLRIAYD